MKKSFSVALRETFGMAGETIASFGAQLKKLTSEDKTYYSQIMTTAGIEHDAPVAVAAAA